MRFKPRQIAIYNKSNAASESFEPIVTHMAAWVKNTQTGLLGHIKLLLVCFAKVLAIYSMYIIN